MRPGPNLHFRPTRGSRSLKLEGQAGPEGTEGGWVGVPPPPPPVRHHFHLKEPPVFGRGLGEGTGSTRRSPRTGSLEFSLGAGRPKACPSSFKDPKLQEPRVQRQKLNSGPRLFPRWVSPDRGEPCRAGGHRSRPRPRGTSPPPAMAGRAARAGVTALLLLTDLHAFLPQAGGGRRSQRECRRPWAPSRCPARSWAGGGGRTGRGATRWTRCARCGARAPSPPSDASRLTERGLARSRRWRWASRSARRRTSCGRWKLCRCGRGTAGAFVPRSGLTR